MPETQPDSPSVPIMSEGPSSLPPFMENLPDQRTAFRLLDVLDKLTRHVQQLQRQSGTQTQHVAQTGPQVLALQQENATLKARQASAKVKLEALLARIQAAAAHDPQPASTPEQEQAA
jgi:FtsZ-binding cell division protein ZapB